MKARILSLFLIFSFFHCWAGTEPQIKAVIFEFEGVIATYDRDLVIDFIAASFKFSRDKAKVVLKRCQELEHNGGDVSKYLTQHARANGLNSTQSRFWLRQWDRIQAIAFKEIPGMLNLVSKLQKKGLITPLFSNLTSQKARTVAKAGFTEHFEPLFLSYLLQSKKPDQLAYRLVLEELALPANACLLIDHKPENVQAALEVGMDGILFENQDQLIEELRKREIDVKVQHAAS